MSDITTVWRTDGGDWELEGTQLKSGDDLTTAVLISLFTDRRASPDDIGLDGTGDLRGWWADDPQRLIGSRLWLLQRAKAPQPETLRRASDYCREALQWLVDDLVVDRFDVFCEWTRPSMLGIQVTAYKPDGTQIAMQYAWVWN